MPTNLSQCSSNGTTIAHLYIYTLTQQITANSLPSLKFIIVVWRFNSRTWQVKTGSLEPNQTTFVRWLAWCSQSIYQRKICQKMFKHKTSLKSTSAEFYGFYNTRIWLFVSNSNCVVSFAVGKSMHGIRNKEHLFLHIKKQPFLQLINLKCLVCICFRTVLSDQSIENIIYIKLRIRISSQPPSVPPDEA